MNGKRWKRKRARIDAWLKQDEPLVLTRVHELLVRDGVEASYRTLVRFAHRELDWRERGPTVRVNDSAPGEEAQVDFGQMGHIQMPGEERRRL